LDLPWALVLASSFFNSVCPSGNLAHQRAFVSSPSSLLVLLIYGLGVFFLFVVVFFVLLLSI
jgi:hypothetical protein